jgi:hypothetical protein
LGLAFFLAEKNPETLPQLNSIVIVFPNTDKPENFFNAETLGPDKILSEETR